VSGEEKFQIITFDVVPRGFVLTSRSTLEEARKFVETLGCDDYEIRQGGLIVEACRAGTARKGQP